MAHVITSCNCPSATANSSSNFIRPTSSACPTLLPGAHHFFPTRPSQQASSLSRRSCRFSCSESAQGVFFHVGDDSNVMGFCFSGIVQIKAGNLSLRSHRKELRCSGEAKEEVSANLSPRFGNPFVRHVLFCSCYSAMRISSKRRASSVSEAFGVTESGLFSLSNDELLSRGFELHSSYEGIDLDQLNSLFLKVGFPRRKKEKLTRALQHTLSLFWLRDVKSDQMIAFARATGDNVFNAIIWDVVVDPSYQGAGTWKGSDGEAYGRPCEARD
ncbi:hypothetical protein O6H91_Y078700 [Diphasiastrum complanatum]|nr:hypothetical protein O6H91_Y078700 [Diphasiastrum complanatum]